MVPAQHPISTEMQAIKHRLLCQRPPSPPEHQRPAHTGLGRGHVVQAVQGACDGGGHVEVLVCAHGWLHVIEHFN